MSSWYRGDKLTATDSVTIQTPNVDDEARAQLQELEARFHELEARFQESEAKLQEKDAEITGLRAELAKQARHLHPVPVPPSKINMEQLTSTIPGMIRTPLGSPVGVVGITALSAILADQMDLIRRDPTIPAPARPAIMTFAAAILSSDISDKEKKALALIKAPFQAPIQAPIQAHSNTAEGNFRNTLASMLTATYPQASCWSEEVPLYVGDTANTNHKADLVGTYREGECSVDLVVAETKLKATAPQAQLHAYALDLFQGRRVQVPDENTTFRTTPLIGWLVTPTRWTVFYYLSIDNAFHWHPISVLELPKATDLDIVRHLRVVGNHPQLKSFLTADVGVLQSLPPGRLRHLSRVFSYTDDDEKRWVLKAFSPADELSSWPERLLWSTLHHGLDLPLFRVRSSAYETDRQSLVLMIPHIEGGSEPTRAEHFDGLVNQMTDLHKAQWCHNDLRPENIIFKSDGSVVIIDFENATKGGGKIPAGFNVSPGMYRHQLLQNLGTPLADGTKVLAQDYYALGPHLDWSSVVQMLESWQTTCEHSLLDALNKALTRARGALTQTQPTNSETHDHS